ncbi:MAG TPA: DNA polymerase III subunit gamma/tau [Candidatus Limnocylindrales bacterium]|nr:DNA polymerase III subunit gamma/tau [Candidatus Limnocylindrales bacterium]
MTDLPIQAPPHQAIYRRWRAQTFAQVVGQEAVVDTLRNAVRTERVAHAILFVGPRGTGKTSLARILAKAVNCTNLQDGDPCDACPSCVAIREGRAMDLVEIDAASNRGIDAIRDLRERINYAPTDLRRKVYILDEAHQITKDAWNALLKSLEEPPDFVAFMFASTHPQDFPPAILSRLQRFDVRRLTTAEIEGKLRRILEADGRAADDAAIHLIARLAAGGMRDAESMLDQLLSSSADRLDEAMVRDLLGLADAESIDGFVDALVAGDLVAGVRLLDGLEDRGRDLRAFLDQVIEVVRGAMVGAGPEGSAMRHAVADIIPVARRLAAIDPNRAGVGGLRLQLELVLYPQAGGAPAADDHPRRQVAGRAHGGAAPIATGAAPAPAARRDSSEPTPVAAAVPKPPAAPSAPSVATPSVATDARARARATGPAPAAAVPAGTPGPKPTAAAAPDPAPAAAPPEPAAAAPAPPVVLGAPADGDLARLREHWSEVVARISAHPPTKPLIAVCRPISVEDGIVTLGFPEDQGFLRDVAERRRSVLEDGIGAVLGRPIGVRCVATNLDLVPALPADAEAAFILAEARRIFGEDEPDARPVD